MWRVKMEIEQELKSIGIIAAEIEKIPEERRSAVVNFVLERFNIQKITLSPSQKVNEINTELNTNKSNTTSNIKEFIEEKKPKNNVQLIATLGYYIEKNEDSEFGSKELNDANSRAKLPPIANTPRDLKNAQFLYHLVTKGHVDKKKKMLTGIGEKVVEALPDQEKVRLVLKDVRKSINKKYLKKDNKTTKEINEDEDKSSN
jgi:hypothetical protein